MVTNYDQKCQKCLRMIWHDFIEKLLFLGKKYSFISLFYVLKIQPIRPWYSYDKPASPTLFTLKKINSQLNFINSEKATKFYEISTLLLSVCTVDKSKVEISQNFVAFSEYTNFI